MATPVENTPRWFDAEHYLTAKLAQLQATEPKAQWTRETMNAAFVSAGFQNPYDHYLANGEAEHLSPNKYFNAAEYLAAKTAQLGSAWTEEMVAQTIKDAGLTLAEHYCKYGSSEGLNPSKSFDQHKYLEAKVEQLLTADPTVEWTIENVQAAFKAAGITPLEHYLAYGVKEGLNDPKYDYAEGGAPIPRPGNLHIALTTGVDVVSTLATAATLKATGRDDIIAAVASGVASQATLNNTDSIDGGAGRDTLKVDMQGNFGGFKDGAGVTNVETIDLGYAGGYTFDATGIKGAESYALSLGGKTATLKNVGNLASVALSADTGATLKMQYTDTALSGAADSAVLRLTDVGRETGAAAVKMGNATGAGLEKLVLQSVGSENYVHVTSTHDTLAVADSGNISVTSSAGGLKTFDATAATGKVNAGLYNSVRTLKTITGSAGDDVISVNGHAADTLFDGGAGNDVLRFDQLTADMTLKPQTTGFETLAVGESTGVRSHVIDLSSAPGVSTVRYEGGKGTVGGDDHFEVKDTGLSDFTFAIKNLTDVILDANGNPINPSTAGQLTYRGTGTLNLVLDAEGGSHWSAGLDKLVANSVTTLNVSNPNATTMLNVANITARAVETLHIDTTGSLGVSVTVGSQETPPDSGTYTPVGNMSALQNVVFWGDGPGTFASSGTETALTTIDATALTGHIWLDLRTITTGPGVEVHMGNGGGTLIGTSRADTLHLGGGSEEVILTLASAVKYGDTITNFQSDDTLDMTNVLDAVRNNITHSTIKTIDAATVSSETIADGCAYVIDNGSHTLGTATSQNNVITKYTDLGQVATYLNDGFDDTTASGDSYGCAFIINRPDTGEAYIYAYKDDKIDTSINAAELKLVGLVQGETLFDGNVYVG